jgi:hypothetical protein
VTDGLLGVLPLQSTALPTELSRESVPSMRIELTTLGLLDPRSNQLSYEGLLKTEVRVDLHDVILTLEEIQRMQCLLTTCVVTGF